MKLHEALGLVRGDVVAFIGAGGKTSALINLGHELVEAGWRVTATTTTHITTDQLNLLPGSVRLAEGAGAVSTALNAQRFVFLYDEIRDERVYGPTPDYFTRLMDTIDSDVLLVKADYARELNLKAPYEHEPVIPSEVSLVVPMASLAVLGQPLTEDYVYNAQAIMDRYGFVEGARVKSPWVAQVIRDDTLGMYGVPDDVRVVVLLNQTPAQGYLRGRARLIGRLILRAGRLNGVALANVRNTDPVHEVLRPVGAVVLAAGMSTRMGQPKVLLPWADGRTIIEHIIHQLYLARVDHVNVVTGYRSGEVRRLVTQQGASAVYNVSYKSGEMLSSLKAGLRAMPDHIAAAMIVLGDQPRIQPRVVAQVMMAYAEGRGGIVAPSFQMRRGHPILIDRRYWSEILDLPVDGSPRDVINAHADEIAYVEVNTDSVLRDVDTPDDYSRERSRAGL